MKLALGCLLLLALVASPAAGQIPGEVSCDKGVDMERVQALVKKTVAALQKDQATVIQQINHGDKRWKDGEYYVFVLQGTKVLAHGYMPAVVGQDIGGTSYQNTFPWVRSNQRMAMERGEGCVEYKFHNPAKGGQVEDKVSYVMRVNGTLWAGSGTYVVRK